MTRQFDELAIQRRDLRVEFLPFDAKLVDQLAHARGQQAVILGQQVIDTQPSVIVVMPSTT